MSGSDPFEPPSPEPIELPDARRERPVRSGGGARPRPSRQPNYRLRRFVAIGIVAVVGVVAAVFVVRSITKDDPPVAEFSLADAAANATKAELVDYEVTILVGDEVITTAEGMIDQRTGSTYLRVSSSIGASSDAALDEAADALGSSSTTTSSGVVVVTTAAPGVTTSADGVDPSLDPSLAPSSTIGGASTSVPGLVPTSSVAGSGLLRSTPTSGAPAPTPDATPDTSPDTTLDGPVVPDDVAAMDEATEVARYVDAEHQVVYVSSGAFAAAGLSFEQPWVRIDLARLGKGVTVDLEQLAGLAGGDPLDVAPLLGASEDVTQIDGDADVDGSPVKRYRVVVPGDQVVAEVPAIAGQLEQLEASVPESFTFVVAVDAGNRIRRLTYEVSNGDRTATTDIVFRVPVEGATIEFPAEADTIDFGEIVR